MQAILYYLSLPFIYLFSSLPLSVLYGFSDYLVFPLMYHLTGYRRKVVRENLVNSFPEKTTEEIKAIEVKFYHYLSDLFIEIFKGFTISKDQIRKRISFEKNDIFQKWYDENKDCVMSAGHYSNHEWVCMTMPLYMPHQIKVPYRAFSNTYMEGLFNRARSIFGAHMFPTHNTYREIMQKHTQPFIVCLANDQSAQPDKAYWTRFLNQDTSFFVGTEKIAKRFNMPVFFTKIKQVKRGYYHVSFELISENPAEEPEGALMEKHAKILEDEIKAAPEFWLWSHRRWKHKMPEGVGYGFNIAKKD